MSNIKDIIDNPHPVYSSNLNYWKFLLQSYEGGIGYSNGFVSSAMMSNDGIIQVKVNGKVLKDKTAGNLFKHKKERVEDYKERIDMSYYYNFCAPIIDIYTNHLFKESVNEDWANIETFIENRQENIDRKGSSIIEFRKETAELAQLYGHIYVITDKPSTDKEVVSLAQQQEEGLFPYLNLFHPQDVLNWALDEFGHPYWVMVKETLNGNTDPFAFDAKKMNLIQYRLWTRTEWILFNASFEEVARANHPCGKVPIDIVYNKPSKRVKNFLGISEIADIAFIARDIYNKCSELNEIIRNQTFAILTLQGKSSDYDELSVGTSKALLYPRDTNAPSYISPAAENADTLMKQIDRQVHKIFQLAKLEGGTAAQEKQIDTQSGVSKAFDFQETNSALAKKAGHMEDGEMRIWDTFAKWEGQASFEGSISYPRDFNIQDLNQDLDEAQKLISMQLGREFNIQIKREIIKKKFPRITDEDREKMIKEVEDKEGKTDGMALRERLPGFFNRNANAEPGGKNGENGNGKLFQKTV